MKLTSKSFDDKARIPGEFAAGIPGDKGPTPGPNRSPHLAWSAFPPAAKSFVVICHDPDVPSKPDDVNKTDRVVPYELPRVSFYHWVLVDIPASLTELCAGIDSDGFVPRGKKPGPTDHGVRGLNSYGDWFAGDPNMSGDYGGYDGPWPPFNDERLHHYIFTVYAVDVPTLGLPPKFKASDALKALSGHTLARAELIGAYALNPKARE